MLELNDVLSVLPPNTDVAISEVSDTRSYIATNVLEGTARSFLNSMIVSTGNVEVLRMSVLENKLLIEIMAHFDEDGKFPF